MPFYASPDDEKVSIRRAAARAGCAVRALKMQSTTLGAPSHVVSSIDCADGWAAARLLLALAIEDARTPGARGLAEQLRKGNDADEDFARAIQLFVRTHVRFEPEEGEEFETGGYTLARGAGDCDAHFRLAFAIAAAGGLRPGLGVLHHGAHAPPDQQGPAHAVAVVELGDAWVYLETTVAAGFGEPPNDAARRLGLTNERSDIAREVRIMTEDDLPPVPEGFRDRNDPAQVTLDAQALQRLGYLATDLPSCALADPTANVLRLAVMQFQRDHALIQDGLLGPTTRLTLARALQVAGPSDFDYPGLSGLGDAPKPIFTHADARAALRAGYLAQFGKEPSAGELDFGLATAYFETFYGRGGAAGWANRGQFGRWAAQGKYNWGALETGVDGEDRSMVAFRAAGLHPTKERGSDAARPVFFYLFPTDEEAARAFLMSWGKPDTLAAAASGDATAVSASMKRHGYYEGFHVAPGKMTPDKIAANARGARFVEEASAEEAERKNVGDYAGALARVVRTVQGPGGVDDPSPASANGGASTASVVGAVAVGIGLAAALAGYWALS